jgi:hypothetical protein
MATAAVMVHVRELVGFLATGSTTQQTLALEHTAALSGSDDGAAGLLEANAATHLQRLCTSPNAALRNNASATLANLCATHERTCERTAAVAGLVEALCDALCAAPAQSDITAECALLANLSTQPSAVGPLAGRAEKLLVRLLDSEDEGTARLAHVLVNAAQGAEFGTRVLRDGAALLLRLVDSQLAHADGVRRQGAAGVLRNLCLGEFNHLPLIRLEPLLPAIATRLLPCNAEIDADDLGRMSDALRAAVGAALESPLPGTLEHEPSIRLMLTECLLALTATRAGREALRAAHVYPVLRESHKREEDGRVIEQNEQIVSLLLGEEEADVATRAETALTAAATP